ncbi:hypothetical protein [Variovorax sp. YR216]|uniref:hypothetical protein n=1 Tax=Variovorax sp. YR216 TaxID=1882828 RepID=UPI00089B52EC|nr:hypothetical protein [Variovorax sp. YR216]SEB01010.1 hypothetical protein SAMN05444680_105203 [Variovorax sp. YR216]
MKRLFCIALCMIGSALLTAVASFYMIDAFSLWYGPRYIKNDKDITTIYLLSLGVWLATIVAGGAAGKMIHTRLCKALARRSN